MQPGRDYVIAALGGAAQGFIANRQNEFAEEKEKKEMARQAQLLMLKDELTSQREMRKQKDQQQFELTKQDKDIGFKREELTSKEKVEQAQRAQKLIDSESKDEFELKKLGIQHSNAVDLEKIKLGGKTEKDIKTARDTLRERYAKEMKDRSEFDTDAAPNFESWAQDKYPEKYQEAFPGSAGKGESSAGAGKISTEGKVKGFDFSGIAARVKGGANQSKQQPSIAAPNEAAPKTSDASADLPMFSGALSQGDGHWTAARDLPMVSGDHQKGASNSKEVSKTTKAVEEALINEPRGVNVGTILGMFAKGLVNVGEMSIEGLKALKWTLNNTGDVSRAMTEPYKELNDEVSQALINTGAFMLEDVPYEQKVSDIKKSTIR